MHKIYLIIIVMLFTSCSYTQLSKTGRPIISIKKPNLIKSKKLDMCIDKVFKNEQFYYKEKIDFRDQYRIRFYEYARNISKNVISLSRISDLNSNVMGNNNTNISQPVLPIKKAGIYEIVQLDMMYLHGVLRMTALLYVSDIDKNGLVLRNVEATSMGSVSKDLYKKLSTVKECAE